MRSSGRQPADLVRLVGSCALLAVILAAASLVIAALVYRGFSGESLSAAMVAGVVCWIAACLALVATYMGNRLHAPVQGVLVSVLFRMGLPLVGLVVLPNLGGGLAGSGMTSTLMGVYLVALVSETALALRMVPARYDASAAKA